MYDYSVTGGRQTPSGRQTPGGLQTPAWHQTIDRYHTALVDDLTAQLDAEITRAVLEERTLAGIDSRRRLSESLNQTLRRMRQTSAEHETLQLLLEDSASCSERAVVLLIENDQARIAVWRGVELQWDNPKSESESTDNGIVIALTGAAAIAACVESRDLVVAMPTPHEISPVLASALRGPDGGKVYLFPVTVRRNTVAVMLASGQVAPAPIELLCEAAGMKLELFELPVATAGPVNAGRPFVQITAAAPLEPAAENGAASWSKLTPEQQALHLRAQRTARVRIAQIRIAESDALRKGARTGDIYNALRNSIDAARSEFEKTYMTQSPTMVDYLHLEIMRSLAHDDSGLLGPDYPGPVQ
jgi:hypothetical protein